jgi:hypothetical protein
MSAPASVTIARAVADTLSAALGMLDVPVERERDGALDAHELPRVLVYSEGVEIDADFVGGAQLRMARVSVEVADAADYADAQGDMRDRVSTLREIVRDALLDDRTLGGACLGLFVEQGGEPRGEAGQNVKIRADTLTVMAYFAD